MPIEAGSRLGHYDVIGELGAGGMGIVYRARDTKLGRDVALKVLPDPFAEDADRLARFQREAQVLASLNHPSIAAIYGFEQEGDTKALVLELVEGPTLADRIAKGPVPLDQSLPIARQIAEALEAAHEAGVIHRDLKPANIKVKDDGTVKVLDFGLAKALQPDASDPALSQSPTISLTAAATQMGMVIGTAAYMAPEQASGKVVDRRADVWAFGVVLYEMLTGTRPFVGDDVSKTLARVIDRDPDWGALPKDLPPVLGMFLRGCLVKDPRERLRDIGDVRLAVMGILEEPVRSSPDAPAVAPPVGWRRAVPLVATAIISALIAGLVVSVLRPPPPSIAQPLMRFGITSPSTAPLFMPPISRAVDVSPDGMHLVYWSGTLGNMRLMRRAFDSLSVTLLQSDIVGAFEGPFISADSAWVGFYSNNALWRTSMLGGPPVEIAPTPWPRGASWGADDTIILGTDTPGGLFRVSAGGGELEELTTPDPEQGERSHAWPDILPGGRAVLFTVLPASGSLEAAQIAVLNLETRERKVLVRGGSNPRYVPTGHIVYGVGRTLRAVGFDSDRLEATTNPVPVLDDVATKASGAVDFGIAHDGSLVYVPGGSGAQEQYSLVWVNREGREEPLPLPARFYRAPRVSADGTRLAVSIMDVTNTDVWVADLTRGGLSRLTDAEGSDNSPIWTIDGESVVFASRRENNGLPSFFRTLADGTEPVEKLLTAEAFGFFQPFGWSEDGTRMVFQYGVPPNLNIGVLAVNGQEEWEPLLASEANEATPALSPNGEWLAYASDQTGRFEIYVRRFPELTERRLVSTSGGRQPVWAPDGRALFYRDERRLMSIQVQQEPTFQLGETELVFEGDYESPDAFFRNYDVHPDGEQFLMVKLGALRESTVEERADEIVVVQHWFEELERLVPTR